MQAGTTTKPSSAASIVAIVGGAILAIGSFLVWATASIDIDKFAQALGVDPALLQGAAGETTTSFSGMDAGGDGKFTLIAGIIAVVLGVVLLMKANVRKPIGAVLIVAGLIGGGVALYDISKVNDVKSDAIAEIGPSLTAAGIDPGILDDVFDVSLGIGIWVCAVGGLIAIIGGVMAIASKAPAQEMTGAVAAPMGSGFDASTPAAPATPPAPMASEPTTPMPPAEPAMPAPTDPTPASEPKPETPGDDQGGTTA